MHGRGLVAGFGPPKRRAVKMAVFFSALGFSCLVALRMGVGLRDRDGQAVLQEELERLKTQRSQLRLAQP